MADSELIAKTAATRMLELAEVAPEGVTLEQIFTEQRKTNALLSEVKDMLLRVTSDFLGAAQLRSQTLPVRSALPQSSRPQERS